MKLRGAAVRRGSAVVYAVVIGLGSAACSDLADTPTADSAPTPSYTPWTPAPQPITPAPVAAPPANPLDGQTTFRILGSGTANFVTWSPDGVSISQASHVSLPWEKSVPSKGEVAVLNAQNLGSGTITCVILRGGVEVTRNESSGPYAMVQCGTPTH